MNANPSDNGQTMGFPAFVEALVRCSETLRAAEKAENSNTNSTSDQDDQDDDATMRFLTLLFAMEGRGTVLQVCGDCEEDWF